jgi:hypothetical protein
MDAGGGGAAVAEAGLCSGAGGAGEQHDAVGHKQAEAWWCAGAGMRSEDCVRQDVFEHTQLAEVRPDSDAQQRSAGCEFHSGLSRDSVGCITGRDSPTPSARREQGRLSAGWLEGATLEGGANKPGLRHRVATQKSVCS